MKSAEIQNLPPCTCHQLGVCNSCIAALCLDPNQQARIDAWDANAFRLAGKLGMTIAFYDNAQPELHLPRECAAAIIGNKLFAVQYGCDKYAAMRQAIAQAAMNVEGEQL